MLFWTNLSLDIKKGDVVGIIGPSGTGKSTLLRCVNRLETPERGTVTIGIKPLIFPRKSQKTFYIETEYRRYSSVLIFLRKKQLLRM